MDRKIGMAGLALALAMTLAACSGTTSVTPDPALSPEVTDNVVARGADDSATRGRQNDTWGTTDGSWGDGSTDGGAVGDVARGIGDAGRGVVNGTGEALEGIGNGLQNAAH